MNPTLNRFINSIGNAAGRKTYSVSEVIENLKQDIKQLEFWLIDNEPDTPEWRMKRDLWIDKGKELEKFEREQNLENQN